MTTSTDDDPALGLDLPGPRKGRVPRLANALRAEIDRGRWKPGEALPTGSELAAAYGVSTAAVSGAIGVLKAQRLLTGPAGGRTKVAETGPDQRELAEHALQLHATLTAEQRAELIELLTDGQPTALEAAEDLTWSAGRLIRAVTEHGAGDLDPLAVELRTAAEALATVLKTAAGRVGDDHPGALWWQRAHQDAQNLATDLANTLPQASR
ncbi:GntR family transcriptional regulator [Kitasatospora sp. NPDC001664]